ncbi:MAG: SiaB family protein kinase [Flavobacteriales bacterium]|nr:SiaB family protein kinase [Flavobacteriales bacterium]
MTNCEEFVVNSWLIRGAIDGNNGYICSKLSLLQSPTIDSFEEEMTTGGEVLRSFEGEITESVLTETLRDIESMLEEQEEDFKKSRKVYNILVEALQNLYHHTDAQAQEILDNGDQKKTARFILARKNGEYNILASNYLVLDNVPPLKSKLDKVNSLDKEGLRAHYKEVLNNGQYSVHGGGGLGMIDIARKSGNKLDYDFASINEDYGLFILKIKV